MTTKKKLLLGAAGTAAAAGAGLDINSVFSTYVYDGTGSSRSITNYIDLSGEGGLVWTKHRNGASQHALFDTERGVLKGLATSSMAQEATETGSVTAFNSNGYTLGGWSGVNGASNTYVSWTWRKAEKWFDIQTWTGDGASDRAISHNLNSAVGMIIVKRTAGGTENWAVWHRDIHANSSTVIYLDQTGPKTTSNSVFSQTNPTSTNFYVGNHPLSNNSGDSYVAYIFAHNNNDGEFGPDSDQDIIKCGSYTGNGSTTGPEINLGFEPQWLLIKRATGTANWFLVDNIRGLPVGANSNPLFPNSANAESTTGAAIDILPTGFQPKASSIFINNSGDTYIYMAIRRGPLAEPESATDVFSTELQNAGGAYTKTTNFITDLIIQTDRSGTAGVHRPYDRLRGGAKYLETAGTAAEASGGTMEFDNNTGYTGSTSLNTVDWVWKRAPGYFDVVAYTGTGVAKTINHNLGAIPEMIWLKRRDAANFEWIVYHKGLNGGTSPEDYVLYLNATNAEADVAYWDDTAPTSTTFRVSGFGQTGSNGGTYIAYLFATVAGVSKVGSYTGDGSAGKVIDCGFSSGARFVLIKKTSDTGGWFVYDTERGIVSGNDPYLHLDSTNAENDQTDSIDPNSSGFAVNYSNTNANGQTYIFYAIA